MAVDVILVVVAAIAVCGVTLWRRLQPNASDAPTTAPIHPEFGPEPAAATPTVTPQRESYYAHAPPNRAKGRPMGWYSVNGDLGDERYWDGRTWTARRQKVSGTWSTVPVGGD
jgi:hypothetical protein